MSRILKIIKRFCVPVLMAICTYLLVIIIFHPFVVSGISMQPTLNDGNIVLCDKVANTDVLDYGEIVVIKTEWWKDIIKRVVAVPGDTVNIANGYLYVNGRESEYQFTTTAGGNLSYPITLGQNEYFCLGDNREHSADSRELGPIRKDIITYKVKRIIAF